MSNSIYLEYNFKVTPVQPASDILIAELGEVQFESFVETEDGVQAYIKRKSGTQIFWMTYRFFPTLCLVLIMIFRR